MTAATIDKLLAEAERLDGRPLPGVRVSEAQFVARYSDEDLKAEWVDGWSSWCRRRVGYIQI